MGTQRPSGAHPNSPGQFPEILQSGTHCVKHPRSGMSQQTSSGAHRVSTQGGCCPVVEVGAGAPELLESAPPEPLELDSPELSEPPIDDAEVEVAVVEDEDEVEVEGSVGEPESVAVAVVVLCVAGSGSEKQAGSMAAANKKKLGRRVMGGSSGVRVSGVGCGCRRDPGSRAGEARRAG